MTNQNNAAQPVLTDDDLRNSSPFQWLARRCTLEVAARMLREFEGIVLSKLRAPVADERALPPLPKAAILWHSDFTNQTYYGYTADHMRDYARAALASAPVAGEAQPFAVLSVHKNGEIRPFCTGQALADAPIQDHERELQRKFGYELVTVYAAPQASEAVQLLRQIREQDYLSDTTRHRIDRLLTGVEAQTAPKHNDGGAVYG